MLKKMEIYLRTVIKGQKKGAVSYLVKHSLLPLSWIYRFTMKGRNWCYDKGWMRQYISPIPLVISVGNIVVGGTGKTPFTLLFAKAFYKRYSIAILSRGYRSKAEKLHEPVVLCEGHGPLYSPSYCGDEPYIFAQTLPEAHVIVGGNRQKASCIAAKAGVQIILLDDGMQHRRLARDFDVVVIDISDPFGQNHFLPRGYLREDKTSLIRANLVVLNHVSNHEQFESVKIQISRYTDAPVIGSCWQVESVKDLAGNTISSLQGVKVGMFCGIAFPEKFKQTLQEIGAEVVAEYILSDHEKPNQLELETFAEQCSKKEACYLICTEKDQVKLSEMNLSFTLPIGWLKMEMRVLEGQQEWENFLKIAEAKIK